MILKGSQRSGGQNLAVHLTRLDDNEHIEIHELRGFASETLSGAFKEAEATSLGTKCRQYLFSLSLSPPADAKVPVSVFEDAIDRIENRLALEGQARAVVFHTKENRLHAHCVWSRINADTMTARTLPFFKNRLREVSRELYLEQGWELPRGLENPSERNPTNFTLAEWQQAKRQGLDPRWLKSTVQNCWSRSDSRAALETALNERGLLLARGDKRGFVVLDHGGEVYSLPKLLDRKTKEVRDRIGDGTDLKSVETMQRHIGEKVTPALRRHVQESRDQFRARSAKLGEYKAEMTQAHRQARTKLDKRQKLEWDTGNIERAARLPRGLRGLWHRITGHYQEVRRNNEAEAQTTQNRHVVERQTLIDKQRDQRAVLQAEFKKLRSAEAAQLLELRRDIGRYIKFTKPEPQAARARDTALGLKLER